MLMWITQWFRRIWVGWPGVARCSLELPGNLITTQCQHDLLLCCSSSHFPNFHVAVPKWACTLQNSLLMVVWCSRRPMHVPVFQFRTLWHSDAARYHETDPKGALGFITTSACTCVKSGSTHIVGLHFFFENSFSFP